MTPLVSIIVPVYNSGNSLARCVDSILNQTFKDFELILLDDGSTDTSGQICAVIPKKINEFKLFTKKTQAFPIPVIME